MANENNDNKDSYGFTGWDWGFITGLTLAIPAITIPLILSRNTDNHNENLDYIDQGEIEQTFIDPKEKFKSVNFEITDDGADFYSFLISPDTSEIDDENNPLSPRYTEYIFPSPRIAVTDGNINATIVGTSKDINELLDGDEKEQEEDTVFKEIIL